jgi:hypothetical protein
MSLGPAPEGTQVISPSTSLLVDAGNGGPGGEYISSFQAGWPGDTDGEGDLDDANTTITDQNFTGARSAPTSATALGVFADALGEEHRIDAPTEESYSPPSPVVTVAKPVWEQPDRPVLRKTLSRPVNRLQRTTIAVKAHDYNVHDVALGESSPGESSHQMFPLSKLGWLAEEVFEWQTPWWRSSRKDKPAERAADLVLAKFAM